MQRIHRVLCVLGLPALLTGALTACSSSNGSPSGGSDASMTDAAESDVETTDGATADGPITDGGASKEAGGSPVVTIGNGQVEGHGDGSVYAFLGIPYAAPPVGDLRWKRPQPPANWTGVKDGSQFGKRCAQNADPTLFTAASADEDCLYLNVWTPNPSSSQKLPVMVWIHGGGNVGGSASDPVPFADAGYFYSGASLAGHDVVVVSFNYRLGVFGFFAHPELATESGKAAGNQGLWDQRFALQWVQANIAQFGGDPSKVTIFGESAGSFDTCAHVSSPQTPPLFAGAISESGGCTTRMQTTAEGQPAILSAAAALGCPGMGPVSTGDGGADAASDAASSDAAPSDAATTADSGAADAGDPLACLRGLSVAQLLASGGDGGGPPTGPFGPVMDGDFFGDQPRTIYSAGKMAKVPYVLGSNNDEGTLFELNATPVTTQDGLTSWLNQQYGDAGTAVAGLYPVSDFDGGLPNPYQAVVTRIVGDSLLVCSTYDTALLAAANSGQNVYMYNFDIPVNIPGIVGTSPGELFFGASHGSELAYVFNTSIQFFQDGGAPNEGISQLMERYWTRFATAGDPNGMPAGSDLMWPPFTKSSEDMDQRMQFTLDPSLVTKFRESQCDYWITTYQAQFSQANFTPML